MASYLQRTIKAQLDSVDAEVPLVEDNIHARRYSGSALNYSAADVRSSLARLMN